MLEVVKVAKTGEYLELINENEEGSVKRVLREASVGPIRHKHAPRKCVK